MSIPINIMGPIEVTLAEYLSKNHQKFGLHFRSGGSAVISFGSSEKTPSFQVVTSQDESGVYARVNIFESRLSGRDLKWLEEIVAGYESFILEGGGGQSCNKVEVYWLFEE